MKPNRKVVVGGAVGGLVAVLTWAVKQFAGVEMPADAAVGLTTALTFIVQYMVPEPTGE